MNGPLNGTMFFNQQDSGARLADMLEALDRSFDDFTIVAVNEDGVLVGHSIAERLGLRIVPMVVREFPTGLPKTYLSSTSFGHGTLHNGADCADGGAFNNLGVVDLPTLFPVLGAEVRSQLHEQTLALNLGGHVFAPERALLVVDEIGDGHGLLAAIEALQRNGTEKVVVVTPVAERWFCEHLHVECISVASVFQWNDFAEDFDGFYASLPADPLAAAQRTIEAFGACGSPAS
jgi:predicted phosphoribosyltransferase